MKKVRQPGQKPTPAGPICPDTGPEPAEELDSRPSHARGSSTRSSPSSSPSSSADPDPRRAAADQLDQLAAAGNLKAIRMVADGIPEKLRGDTDPAAEPIAPHVAAAAVAAGLYAHQVGPERAEPWTAEVRRLTRADELRQDGQQTTAGPAPRPPGR